MRRIFCDHCERPIPLDSLGDQLIEMVVRTRTLSSINQESFHFCSTECVEGFVSVPDMERETNGQG